MMRVNDPGCIEDHRDALQREDGGTDSLHRDLFTVPGDGFGLDIVEEDIR